MEQVGGEGKRDALLRRVVAQVEIPWQTPRSRPRLVVVEYHREPRIRPQPLAAGAGSQPNRAQVHRHRANRANAIQAELDLKLRAQRLELLEVIERAGRGFA